MTRGRFVLAGVVLVLGWAFWGFCQSLYPDEAGAKHEVERVIPPHMQVVEITGDNCRLPIAASCNIRYSLAGNPGEFVGDARLVRDRLLGNGWTETGYSEDPQQAGGTYKKGSMGIAVTIRSAEALAACAWRSCTSLVTVTPQ